MDEISHSLMQAQIKAQALFTEVVQNGMIRSGKLESELSEEIHTLAKSRFGLRRHWHKRLVRSGPNTLLTYYDEADDRLMQDDDIVYLDFGPVFEAWEADFGRTYAIGGDPAKHRLVFDIAAAFKRGKDMYKNTPDLTAGALYDFVAGLAAPAGWEFGASSAGHLIGEFPHEQSAGDAQRFSIRHGNDLALREPSENGKLRHWILEIHFVDRAKKIGGFFEELLTVDTKPG